MKMTFSHKTIVTAAVCLFTCISLFLFAGCASGIYVDTSDSNAIIKDAANGTSTETKQTNDTTSSETGTPSAVDTAGAPSAAETDEKAPETTAAVQTTPANPKPEGTIRICIDPGHGFVDGGTGPAYLVDKYESEIVLDIALKLKDELTAAGYDIVMTHDGKTFNKSSEDDGNQIFNPIERIAFANTQDLDFYVSIHCDSYESDESICGTRVYYCERTGVDNSKAQSAAEKVTDAITNKFPDSVKSRTISMQGADSYYVIRESDATSILIETGFITNKTDAQNMLDEAWRADMAKAIADGINSYFGK